MQESKPNLLFVFSDQHRWCDMGCYGNDEVSTPNFDRFAAMSARFENCIANNPLCVPSRGSLLTGLLPLQHGAIANDLPIRTDVESVAHLLGQAGYQTGYIGKWHLIGVPRDRPVLAHQRLGFSEWKVSNCNHQYMDSFYHDENNNRIPLEGYEPITQTDLAIEFMERNKEDSWGLYLSWGPPHDPYNAVPQKYLDMYAPNKLTLRPNVPAEIIQFEAELTPPLFQNAYQMENKVGQDKMRQNLAGYYAHITALDEQFGRLLSHLEATGQLENTIVVYTSDHGDMIGSQGFINKQLPYDEAIKVPLLVHWQGKTVVSASDELIGLVDLPVSLMGLLGLEFAGERDGTDLSRLFTNESARGLEACYINDLVPCHQAEIRGATSWRGIRTTKHTFARTPFDEGSLMFDNETDPYQQNNLIADERFADKRKKLLELTELLTAKYDELLSYGDLLRKHDLVAEWNKSQQAFQLPELKRKSDL